VLEPAQRRRQPAEDAAARLFHDLIVLPNILSIVGGQAP
jgi:hypothetical protein